MKSICRKHKLDLGVMVVVIMGLLDPVAPRGEVVAFGWSAVDFDLHPREVVVT